MLTIFFLFRKAFYITPPLFFTATAQGACAPGGWAKNKNTVQGNAYTAREAELLHATRPQEHNDKTTLYKKGRTIV